MFAEQYGLNQDPFALEPDPRFLVLTKEHQEALATLVYAIEQQEGWALLLGDVGVGKTTTLSALLKELGPEVAPAVISCSGLQTPLELMNRLALELNLSGPYKQKALFLADLRELIQRCRAEGKSLLLVLDDAQVANPELMAEVDLLGNADLESPRVLNIFLVARPELVYLMDQAGALDLKQQFRRFCRLRPLDRGDTLFYVTSRVQSAGGSPGLFDQEACEALYEASQGVPRRLNLAAAWSLSRALASGRPGVGRQEVMEAVDQVRGSGLSIDDYTGPVSGALPPADLTCPLGTPLPQLTPDQQALEDSLASRHHRLYRSLEWWERTIKFTVEWDRMRRRRLGILGTAFANFCSRWDQPFWADFDQARREADAAGARYEQWVARQFQRVLGNSYGEVSPAQLHGKAARIHYQSTRPATPEVAPLPAPPPLPDPLQVPDAARAKGLVSELLDLSRHICDGKNHTSEDLLAEAVCQAVLPLEALKGQPKLQQKVAQAAQRRAQSPPDPLPPGQPGGRPPIII